MNDAGKKLLGKVYGKLRYETQKRKMPQSFINFFDKKEVDSKMQYAETKYNNILDKYANCPISTDKNIQLNTIWICWLQGLSQAPDWIKCCIESIKTNNPNRKIIFLSEKNISDFYQVPTYITEKYKRGIIGPAHYSDVIRMGILKTHGGLWVDATIYAKEPFPENFFTTPFFSLVQEKGMHKKYNISILFDYIDGRWTSFLFSSEPNGLFVSYMLDFYLAYWQQEDEIIDYLMIDYMFIFLYRRNPYFQKYVDHMTTYPLQLSLLNEVLNEEKNKALDSIKKSNALLIFKTSYKELHTMKTDNDSLYSTVITNRIKI